MTALSVYDNFVWREVGPGVWQRDADEAEVFYSSLVKQYAGSGRMHFAISGHVSLTIPVSEGQDANIVASRFDSALRTAWLRLRHQLPSIGSQVHFDSREQKWKKTYTTLPDDGARNAWLGKTFHFVATGQTGLEWAISDPPAPELATLFVVSAAASSGSRARRDIILRSPHDIIDGIGTLQLLNAFVHHASQAFSQESPVPVTLCDGTETTRLSPPYRVAADVPPVPTPEQQAKQAALQEINNAPRDLAIESISIPYQQGALLPGKHQRVAHTIPTDRASTLLAALKGVGATPTHAFHAAIAMAVRDLHTESLSVAPAAGTRVKYINYILRNERRTCQPPFNGPDHAAAVYHSVSGAKLNVTMPAIIPTNVTDRDQQFLDILAQTRQFYHSVRDDKDHFALAPYIWSAATPSLPLPQSENDEWNVPVPLPNSKPSVSISSMGLIDKLIASRVDDIEVHNPWVTGEELGTGLGLFLGTFRGEMELSAAFNEAWHTVEEVSGFLDRCEEIVFGWVDRG
ncbi:hypothetical protein QBC36DRAFT_336253 [Triangularia setosa]|uniref:Uncharacterized protein n=1 Tax=Triangularia setosa TaxID=2587417 RepID=A0AAN6W0K6_9PEZI|nr:hypothetical protein QBC36DRAFT_336253 [Podospora setosa]